MTAAAKRTPRTIGRPPDPEAEQEHPNRGYWGGFIAESVFAGRNKCWRCAAHCYGRQQILRNAGRESLIIREAPPEELHSMMKEAIKAVVRRVPGKKIIFSFVRLFGVPSFYKSLRFKGRFRLPLTKEKSIKLWNNDDYSIETEWFWRGINGWEAASIQIWMNLCSSKTFGSVPVIWDIGACEGIYALVAQSIVTNSTCIGA